MLTKTDLSQIRDVVREEVDATIEDRLKPIKKDLSQIGQVIDEKLEPIKKDLKYLKKKINRIDKTVDIIVKNYDEADVKLFRRISFVRNPAWKLPSGQRRVRKIEHHLALPEEN